MNILPFSDIPSDDYLFYLNTLDDNSLGLWGFPSNITEEPTGPTYIATAFCDQIPPDAKRPFQNLVIDDIEYSAFITKQSDLYWLSFTFGDYSVFNITEFEKALAECRPFWVGTYEKRTVWIGL